MSAFQGAEAEFLSGPVDALDVKDLSWGLRRGY